MQEVKILSIGTAVPKHHIKQPALGNFMHDALNSTRQNKLKLRKIFSASGIEKRHTVVDDFSKQKVDFNFFNPGEFLTPSPTISTRMRLYEKHAAELCDVAINECLSNHPSDNKKEITHLITFSCTGMYAPGLDIDIVNSQGLNKDIERTCINFMGCYAAFNALKSAYHIVRSQPNAKVLLAGVELCSLHYHNADDEDQLIANAIFADGAAACLVGVNSSSDKKISLGLKTFHSEFSNVARNEMVWSIGDNGFNLKLTGCVPDVIEKEMAAFIDKLLKKENFTSDDIHYYAIHPGGMKILQACEKALSLVPEQNSFSYEVLKNYGNMSSVTVLFVLKSYLNSLNVSDKGKNILSCAFGPGLTMESMVLNIC